MIYDTNTHPLHAAALYDYVLLKIYQTFTRLPYMTLRPLSDI